jgi:hypothetical protein
MLVWWFRVVIARLERICRFVLRPPVAHDRTRLTDAGQVLVELRHRWADGTTHLLFDPLELLERLAALTPRPRINLVLYYGVLGAHAAWRSRLAGPEAVAPASDTGTDPISRPPGTDCRLRSQTRIRHHLGGAVRTCSGRS